MLKLYLCLFLGLSMFSQRLLAQTCLAEEKVFCAGKKASSKDDFFCLYDNYDQLGQACQNFLKSQLKVLPCFNDSLKLCKGKDLNASKALTCLRNKEPMLSNRCKSWLNEVKSKANKKEKLVISACPNEWKACLNPDFRKQRACMENMKKTGTMSAKCEAVYTQAIKRK